MRKSNVLSTRRENKGKEMRDCGRRRLSLRKINEGKIGRCGTSREGRLLSLWRESCRMRGRRLAIGMS